MQTKRIGKNGVKMEGSGTQKCGEMDGLLIINKQNRFHAFPLSTSSPSRESYTGNKPSSGLIFKRIVPVRVSSLLDLEWRL